MVVETIILQTSILIIIGLKENYLWPSMWDDKFSEDGKEDKNANAKINKMNSILLLLIEIDQI